MAMGSSTDRDDLIAASLEAVAERHGDPAPAVYARLFAAFPEMEVQFVRDTTGAVRGEMLAVAFQCLLDLDGGYAANLIRAEVVNHEGVGVPPDVFALFFPTVRDACRDLAGDAWTPAVEAAWSEALAVIEGLVAPSN